MSWSDFFKDIAKDAAKDYVAERGVKGVMEDAGNLLRGAKEMFSDDDDDDDDDGFVDIYNEYIEDEQYREAEQFVKSYYNTNSLEKDSFYHALLAEIYYKIAVDEDSVKYMNKAEQEVGIARKSCPIGSDLYDSVRELQQNINSDKASIKQRQAVMQDRNVKASVAKQEESKNSKNSNNSNNKKSEQEYMDEIKACLADDGVITDRERRLLDKLRKSLGISEVRACELEKLCNPSTLTAEEQEYAAEIKACLEDDGEITEREARLLKKLSMSLGISDARAVQIQKMIQKK